MHVSISDSGFYFCGATDYQVHFGSGTQLEVKEKKVIIMKNDTEISKKDNEKYLVSTKECSQDIFFKLTLLFGGIIVCTFIISLIIAIIRQHKRQKQKKVTECQEQHIDDKEPDSVEYAAVHFSMKPRTAGRHTEDTIVMYTDST
ncbi:novel immune-type receptor 10a [Xyrauchen texanus]|uniref:novel immune-type receptor 10a n=1 Tax=Xyrauchen texanus TaxID=154827 RepID=UPI002241A003|nr:novel immune-type receptor 10a [Xyrauchen texanus]